MPGVDTLGCDAASVDGGDMVDGVADPGLTADGGAERLAGGRDMCRSGRRPLAGRLAGIRALCAAVDGHGGGIGGFTDPGTEAGCGGSISMASGGRGRVEWLGVGESGSFMSTSSFSLLLLLLKTFGEVGWNGGRLPLPGVAGEEEVAGERGGARP